MQNLLCKTLVVSGLTALGIASCAGVSYAGTADLYLSTAISLGCNFTSSTYNNPSGVVSVPGNFAESITWEGYVGVTCNNGGNVQISSSPTTVSQAVSEARTLSTYKGEYLSVGGTNIWKQGSSYSAESSVTLAPNPSIPYVVVLRTTPGSSGPGLTNGNYSYRFTLTATPN